MITVFIPGKLYITCLCVLKERTQMSKSVFLRFPELLHCSFFSRRSSSLHSLLLLLLWHWTRASSPLSIFQLNFLFWMTRKVCCCGLKTFPLSSLDSLTPACIWTRLDRLHLILHQLLPPRRLPVLVPSYSKVFSLFFFGTASNMGAPVK